MGLVSCIIMFHVESHMHACECGELWVYCDSTLNGLSDMILGVPHLDNCQRESTFANMFVIRSLFEHLVSSARLEQRSPHLFQLFSHLLTRKWPGLLWVAASAAAVKAGRGLRVERLDSAGRATCRSAPVHALLPARQLYSELWSILGQAV